MKKYLILVSSLLFVTGAEAKVLPGSLITDNMVLAQNSNARIYGWADPGSEITVVPSWDNKTYRTTTDMTGEWSLAVATPKGGYDKYTLTISDGEPVVISNVLVGEVWLGSGQSNMQMPLKGFPGCVTRDGYDEIAGSSKWADKIRFYTVPLSQSATPVEKVDAVWTVPSPDTATEYSATAWFFAQRLNEVLDVPVGIVSDAYGGAKVESWMPREIVEGYEDISLDPAEMEKMIHYHRPVLMYNAMFVPVKNYTYDGIIWYQGCSNVGKHETYPDRLATMVKHWRDQIGLGEIPFYAVEIAPYDYGEEGGTSWAALLRQAQWKAISQIPNSGMISTNDLVEPYERYNIHPSNKKGVGHRLGNLVLNKTYGKKQFLCESPKYKSHKFVDGAAWVAIDSPSDGICRNYQIEGFEVAGADGIWHPADSVWNHWETNELVVSSKEVKEPTAVRYGWGDFKPGNLHAADYLPLIPFTTEEKK